VVALAQSPSVGVKVYVPLAVLLTVAGLQVPVIPLVEVVGKIGAVAPLHIGTIAAKDGVVTAFTVTDKLAVLAQSPTVGVKVYVPLAVLLTVAGLHVPVMPLFDVVGKTGAVLPLHIAAIAVNVGVTFGVTVTVKLAEAIQVPELALKTYVPLAVLLTVAGFQVPVIPFVDVVGKTGAVAPLQIADIAAKVGVVEGFTVTVIVSEVAHWPAVGVNVYVAVVVLLTVAGVQVPVIPLVEVVGKIGAVVPLHIGAIAAKVGVVTAFTVTFKVVVLAQSPTVGVKVYVPLAVLLTVAGLQVPVIPLVEVVGKTGAVAPLQIAGTAANVGITVGFTVTVKLAVAIQLPELAVKT
jgi:hypothetical protein